MIAARQDDRLDARAKGLEAFGCVIDRRANFGIKLAAGRLTPIADARVDERSFDRA